MKTFFADITKVGGIYLIRPVGHNPPAHIAARVAARRANEQQRRELLA